MAKLLVVVDMQKDFIDGALGTAEAVAILPAVEAKIAGWDGDIVCTLDTHDADYLSSAEGKKLPVSHCIKGTDGWQIHERIKTALDATGKDVPMIEKPTFGSMALVEDIALKGYTHIEFVGLCTDICVISNVMITKAALPEATLVVDAACCAGVTPDSHRNALSAMAMCQVDIVE